MDKIILVSKQLLQIQNLISRKDEKKNTIRNIALEIKKKYVRIIESIIKTKEQKQKKL